MQENFKKKKKNPLKMENKIMRERERERENILFVGKLYIEWER